MNNGITDYYRLSETMGDVMREKSARNQRYKDWTIINMLPTDLQMFYKKKYTDDLKFLTSLPARVKKSFKPDMFEDEDELYAFHATDGKPNLLFMPPYTMRDFLKDIKVGTVVYDSNWAQEKYQVSYSDIAGIRIHNMLRVPLDIYYNRLDGTGPQPDQIVAQVRAYDGLSYLGGGGASIFFDNDRDGLNFMDEISFKYSLPGKKGKYMITIALNDNQMNDVYVGMINGGHEPPPIDTYAYSVDKPVWTGYTYYVPIGGYRTRATNPLAPI